MTFAFIDGQLADDPVLILCDFFGAYTVYLLVSVVTPLRYCTGAAYVAIASKFV